MASFDNPSSSTGAKRKYESVFYDFMVKNKLASPSLTVQWLPSPEKKGETIPERIGSIRLNNRLVVGACNAGKDNRLSILSVLFSEKMIRIEINGIQSKPCPANCSFKTVAEIKHPGVVNRARYMPQNPEVLATKSSNGDVYVYDVKKVFLATNNICKPKLMLKGLTAGGKGISWNPNRKGYILSCSTNEGTIRLWDINSKFSKNGIEYSLNKFNQGHPLGINDCSWHSFHSSLFLSAGNDKNINLWDIRVNTTKMPVITGRGHESSVNCLSFNYFSDHLLATGSSDKTVALWDVRKMGSPCHQINWHNVETFQLQWSPNNKNILASSGGDDRVLFWDISKIGVNRAAENAVIAPPEHIFTLHSGTENILDFSWNMTEPLLMSSVSQDKIIQVWQMGNHLYDNTKKISSPEPSKPTESPAPPVLPQSVKPILLSQGIKTESYQTNLETLHSSEQNHVTLSERPSTPDIIELIDSMLSSPLTQPESAESILLSQEIKSEAFPTNLYSLMCSATEKNPFNPLERPATPEMISLIASRLSEPFPLTETAEPISLPQGMEPETTPTCPQFVTNSTAEQNPLTSRLFCSTRCQNSNSKDCHICDYLKSVCENEKLLSEINQVPPDTPLTEECLKYFNIQNPTERPQSATIEKLNDPSSLPEDTVHPEKNNFKKSQNDILSLQDQVIPTSRDVSSVSRFSADSDSENDDEFVKSLLCTEIFNPPDSPSKQT